MGERELDIGYKAVIPNYIAKNNFGLEGEIACFLRARAEGINCIYNFSFQWNTLHEGKYSF